MAIGYRRIAEPQTLEMVKQMLWLTIASIILSRGQLVVTNLLGIALELRRVRVMQVFYYLAVLAVVLTYAVKHLFRPDGATDLVLSPGLLSGSASRTGNATSSR